MTPSPLLPVALGRWFRDPTFWGLYHLDPVGECDPGGSEANYTRFPLGSGFALGLTVSGDLSEAALAWHELELAARLQAILDPELPHPGPVLLLLARFAPVCDDADAALAGSLLAAAERSVGLQVSDRWRRLFDLRDCGVGFDLEDDGHWRPWQSDEDNSRRLVLGSLRTEDDFPHADLAAAFAAADRAYRQSVPAAWRTRHVRTLAVAAVADLSTAPVLADALDDAGDHRPDLAAALRSGVPARAGWVAEWLLGDCSGDAVRRACGPAPPPLEPEAGP